MPDRSRSRSPAANAGPVAFAGVTGAELIWVKYTTPEGNAYYHQRETNQTVWERPAGPNDRVVDHIPTSVPTAAVVWLRCCAPGGLLYYHQPQTQQTVWEKPSGPSDQIVDHPSMATQQLLPAFAGVQPQAALGMYGGAKLGTMPGAMAGMLPGLGLGIAGLPAILGTAGTDVDAFIARNNIDASAAAKLRALPADLRAQVIGRGDLQDARNPNAVLMGRIKDAECGIDQLRSVAALAGATGTPAPSGEASSNVEQFITENRIDPIAGGRLRALPADMQKNVMERGNLTGARNPNAMLMGRIREAERGV